MRTALALALLFTFGGGTLGCTEDRVIQPAGDSDAAVVADPPDAGPTVDGGGAVACDMNGRFIQIEITHSTALGATQTTRNWFYHEVTQAPDGSFTITRSLNCGIRVTGTTTVTLPDATTEALALKTSYSTGRKGFAT